MAVADLYHTCFPHDRAWLQCLGEDSTRKVVYMPTLYSTSVYGTVVFEWVQSGLLTENAFFSYVENYGNYADLVPNHNAWFSAAIMCAIVSLVVQSFYAWRIFFLGRSYYLVVAVGMVRELLCSTATSAYLPCAEQLGMMQAGAGIAFGVMVSA